MTTRAKIVDELRALGLRAGSTVMVHASLREVGPVDGGADGLLDAVLDVLGPNGTLIMPLGASMDAPFERWSSPADPDIGALAEVFRRRPETFVNDHAAARFGAIGPSARALLEPIPLHDYYGPGSPLSRIVAADGQVLRLDADEDTVTVTHWAEYLAEVPNKRRARRRYERADTGEQWIESLDDTDGIAQWSGGDYFSQILIDYLAGGHAKVGPVGRCEAELLSAKHFVDFAAAWMERHLT